MAFKRGDKFVNVDTGERIVFHHYRPLSRWSSFRKEDAPSEKVHLPPVEILDKISDWKPDESS